MSAQHTPGRLVVRGGYSIYANDGKTPVADTCLTASVQQNDEANARRLVACWNRLEPFTTEQIEDFGCDLFSEVRPRYLEAVQELRAIHAQRDELLAALKKARSGLSNGLWDYGPGQDEHTQCNALIEEIDAAIAKVTGEQT